jgi:hypothetical protein
LGQSDEKILAVRARTMLFKLNRSFGSVLKFRCGRQNERNPTMPALWPIILVAANTAVAEVPKFNIGPTCGAAAARTGVGRPQGACERDEDRAHATLGQQWRTFPEAERQRCTIMTQTGGSPSYVELLTCLQTAAEAAKLPKTKLEGPVK